MKGYPLIILVYCFTKDKQMKIAFGYKMGSGKDTAVSYLKSRFGGVSLSFAEPLYEIMHYTQKRCGMKIQKDRLFLQLVGTEWGRNIDPDIWIHLLLEKVASLQKEKTTNERENIYISDLRFINEMKALKNNGWICVKLVRDFMDERKGTGKKTHKSEHELDTIEEDAWDYIIENKGTLEEFYARLDNMMEKLSR